MAETSLPFPQSEYDRRLALVRRAMDAAGIEVLFVESPANMAWLTGYDGWSFYVHQGVIVPPEGNPLWWGRHMDGFGAHRTVWMPDDDVLTYSDDYVQATDCHPMQTLASLLGERGFGAARIGVEMDSFFFTARAMAVLGAELGEATFVDATSLVNWQRAVKSAPELDFMRKAGTISQRIVEGLMERVEPGLPKNELVAEIYRDAIRGVDGVWGDYPAIVPLLPSGADAAASHLTWDGRPFRAGEATFFEISGCFRRYHAPLCRTVYLGRPPQDMLDAEAALVTGIAAGIEIARPGNRACDIALAVKAELTRAGIGRAGRVGYSVGLAYPPDWGEHTISLRESDETVLRPGMAFHFMPGLWMADWGLEITETIVIRDDGPAECLSAYPRKLVVKD